MGPSSSSPKFKPSQSPSEQINFVITAEPIKDLSAVPSAVLTARDTVAQVPLDNTLTSGSTASKIVSLDNMCSKGQVLTLENIITQTKVYVRADQNVTAGIGASPIPLTSSYDEYQFEFISIICPKFIHPIANETVDSDCWILRNANNKRRFFAHNSSSSFGATAGDLAFDQVWKVQRSPSTPNVVRIVNVRSARALMVIDGGIVIAAIPDEFNPNQFFSLECGMAAVRTPAPVAMALTFEPSSVPSSEMNDIASLAPVPTAGPTSSLTSKVLIVINLDEKPEETGFSLSTATGAPILSMDPGTLLNEEGKFSKVFSVPANEVIIITLLDSGGDGLNGDMLVYQGTKVNPAKVLVFHSGENPFTSSKKFYFMPNYETEKPSSTPSSVPTGSPSISTAPSSAPKSKTRLSLSTNATCAGGKALVIKNVLSKRKLYTESTDSFLAGVGATRNVPSYDQFLFRLIPLRCPQRPIHSAAQETGDQRCWLIENIKNRRRFFALKDKDNEEGFGATSGKHAADQIWKLDRPLQDSTKIRIVNIMSGRALFAGEGAAESNMGAALDDGVKHTNQIWQLNCVTPVAPTPAPNTDAIKTSSILETNEQTYQKAYIMIDVDIFSRPSSVGLEIEAQDTDKKYYELLVRQKPGRFRATGRNIVRYEVPTQTPLVLTVFSYSKDGLDASVFVYMRDSFDSESLITSKHSVSGQELIQLSFEVGDTSDSLV